MDTQPSLVHRATTAGHSSTIDNQQFVKDEPRRESLSPLKVYLNLELLVDEVSDDYLTSSKQTIKQGKSYDIIVYASDSLNPDVKQVELTITSDIELLLECMLDEDTPSIIIIEKPWRLMTYQQVALREEVLSSGEEYETFRVTVPNDSPKGVVSFRLSYRKVPNKIKLSPRFATSIGARVDGPYDSDDKVLRKQCYIDADTPLPERTAILYVTEVNSGKLHMTCGVFATQSEGQWPSKR